MATSQLAQCFRALARFFATATLSYAAGYSRRARRVRCSHVQCAVRLLTRFAEYAELAERVYQDTGIGVFGVQLRNPKRPNWVSVTATRHPCHDSPRFAPEPPRLRNTQSYAIPSAVRFLTVRVARTWARRETLCG